MPQDLQDFALLYGKDQEYKDWYAQMFANQGEYQIPSYGLLTTTPLWTEAQATLGELTTRSFLELVRADSDEEASALFDTYVENWLSLGGEAAQAEMSAALRGYLSITWLLRFFYSAWARRRKLLYKEGQLLDALTRAPLRQWEVVKERIEPAGTGSC